MVGKWGKVAWIYFDLVEMYNMSPGYPQSFPHSLQSGIIVLPT
jgi:hypothetical protein